MQSLTCEECDFMVHKKNDVDNKFPSSCDMFETCDEWDPIFPSCEEEGPILYRWEEKDLGRIRSYKASALI